MAGNRSWSACCSPHKRAKHPAAQCQRYAPGRRDVSRRRVLPGATGQLVDTQIGTALPVTGTTASKRFRQAPTTCASGWGAITGPITTECGAEPTCGPAPYPTNPRPYRPQQLPAKAPSSRHRSGLQAPEDVPVVLSGGQRMRPGWRARPQVARARRGSRPLRLLRALRGLLRKVAPERQPLSDFASGRPTSNGSLCQLLSAKAPVFSPSRGRPHRCRCHGCRCPYCY